MSKKYKPLPIINNVEVLNAVAEGKSMAKIDDMVLFIENAIPGDVVDVQLTLKKKSYAEGKAIFFHKKSNLRIAALCEHVGTCGGCKWQELSYENQLIYKQQQVIDHLQRIGKLDYQKIYDIKGADNIFYYRNKIEYSFTNFRWLNNEDMEKKNAGLLLEGKQMNALGFHIPKKFDKVFHVNKCHLQANIGNDIRNYIFTFAQENDVPFFDLKHQHGNLRTLMIRNTTLKQTMVVLMITEYNGTIEKLLTNLKENFTEITSLNYVVNTKRNDSYDGLTITNYSGTLSIQEKLHHLTFNISAKSFFQTNTAQAEVLYAVTKDFAALKGDEIVYDLYTGTGTIANYLAHGAKKVIGVEYIEDAVKDAYKNAQDNSIDNVSFFAGDMKDVFNDSFVATHGKPNVIITDPPRAGMHADVINVLLNLAPQKIVYVSCNTATQARDMALLAEKYIIGKIQPVDMFPHTHHVENVALLVLK